ncbi:universal stress protein [Fulvivirga sp. 29W222]|uniref:Universal stress protein n=1 Tax=Fulvivirga marina TaxID=2494733 RepID=A0A937G2B6_9BACT|nr:universal stress protein [Fulvivirga marina]MBL6448926.1 universal stress protein [Fulvivirga marina]
MNKILCPIDFSDSSLNAIEFAVEIGKKFRSTVTLVHIFTEHEFNEIVGEASIGRSFKELLGMATTKLKKLADQINADYKSEGLLNCEYHIALGELTDRITDMITEEQYDLIVMGTTGISRVRGVFVGSNTEDIIEKAKVPVLCVPEDAIYQGFNKVVYASDFMKEDKMAIQEVISFATLFDARISVLHINLRDDEEHYNNFIEELKSFIQYGKINFVNKRFKNDIGLAIEEFMQDEKSDLLVVYRKQRGFLDSMFHKSLTKTLSYSTDKPFLVLKLENNNID